MPPELAEIEVEEQPSLREAVEAAVEEHEEAPAAPAPAGSTSPAPSQAPAVSEPTPQAAPSQTPAPGKAPIADPSAQPTDKGQPAPVADLKPPQQWKPHVRDMWKDIPRPVQEEILRREGDSMRVIGSVGQKVAFANEVSKHFEPFAQRLQENGVSHAQFLGEVFGSIKALGSPNPMERAEVVANIIQSYGVDLRTLDGLLSRRMQTPPEVIRAQQETARAQRMVQNVQARDQQAQVQQQNEAANQALASFAADPKHEFFEDVRDMMADLLQSGHSKDLESAYQAAIWANAETRQTLLQREAQARLQTKQQRAAQARLASSSVTGTPRGSAGAPGRIGEGMTLRETISAAMDEAEERA